MMDNKSTLLMWVGFLSILAGGTLLLIAWIQAQYSMGNINTWIASLLVLVIGIVVLMIGVFKKND